MGNVVNNSSANGWNPRVSTASLANGSNYIGFTNPDYLGFGGTDVTQNTNLPTSFNNYSTDQLNSLYNTFLQRGGVPDPSYGGLTDAAKADYLTKGLADLNAKQAASNSSWFSTDNLNKVSTGMQALGTLANAYIGFENLGLAKNQYKLQKNAIESQLAFLREDRARADALRASAT